MFSARTAKTCYLFPYHIMHYLFLTLQKAFPKHRKTVVVVFLEGQEGRETSVEGPTTFALSLKHLLLVVAGDRGGL